ncbi:MAG: helix-turn-helix domain-containing protein [bacterium]
MENLPIRLSISEAAKLFGVEQKTIRRAIKKQEIIYIVIRGRYKLDFNNLLKWSQKKTTVKNKLSKNGIGQFVDVWKINNKLYSPNPKRILG